MGKTTDLEKQIDNKSGGRVLSGTKFGQTPGEASHEPPTRPGSGRRTPKSSDAQTRRKK